MPFNYTATYLSYKQPPFNTELAELNLCCHVNRKLKHATAHVNISFVLYDMFMGRDSLHTINLSKVMIYF